MSMLKRPGLALSIAVFAVVAVAFGGTLVAETQGLRAFAGGPVAGPLTEDLPPVARGPMTVTPDGSRATSVLSFDDGTCESGLGVGGTLTALVDFDVPTQCIQAGLDIVGLTTRINSGTGTAFAFAQAGPIPPVVGAVLAAPLGSALPPLGACPATGMSARAIGPGAAVITGTSNFFAGLFTPNGYPGRDSNGPSAGRMWALCGACGMTQYSPTDLVGIGFGGNWMIRVTVEDANCVPVELMGFTIE